MLSMLRSKKGFTLIELMIVVAIIGILAAIAIPNFLRFQAKSRQSEAKTNLGGIFTAETAHFGEHNTFADLNVVSWAPVGTSVRYRYQMVNAGTNALGQLDTALVSATWAGNTTLGAAASAFTAGAQGNIDTDTQLDCWTMNDVRTLSNEKDDVTL
jgi:type IV pilus assembly protein PilA